MITPKTKEGIARMRDVCAIAADTLQALKPLVKPGITTQDLEEAGRDIIAKFGAKSACFGYQHGSHRYPAHTCISVNEEVVHGIPSFKKVLREGDIVSMWRCGTASSTNLPVPHISQNHRPSAHHAVWCNPPPTGDDTNAAQPTIPGPESPS